MATPLSSHRRRLANNSASTPARSSPLAKSPSTPYDVFRLQHNIPFTSTADHTYSSSPSSSSPSAFLHPSSPNAYAPYRRNVGFGSPGSAGRSPRTSQGPSSSHVSPSPGYDRLSSDGRGSKSSRFIRRKSMKQKLLEAPQSIYDRIVFSEFLDLGDPALGYPLGVALHVVSFFMLMLHPNGALHYDRKGKRSSRGNATLFSDQTSLASRRQQHQSAAWKWTAIMIGYILLTIAIANAVHLFTATRRYQLWLKRTDEPVPSENASLVDIPDQNAFSKDKRLSQYIYDACILYFRRAWCATWWLTKKILWRMRSLSYIGVLIRILFPLASAINSARHSSHQEGPKMHAIDMWQAPEVPLRIFCLYSPLHAIIYLTNMNAIPLVLHAPAPRVSTFFAGLIFMAALSAQTSLVVYFFRNLIRDKAVIAGEVMNEYNEKFVLPRAMPACRDASTMTMQSEIIGPDDLQTLPHRHSTWNEPLRNARHSSSSSHARHPKKGRSTIGV